MVLDVSEKNLIEDKKWGITLSALSKYLCEDSSRFATEKIFLITSIFALTSASTNETPLLRPVFKSTG